MRSSSGGGLDRRAATLDLAGPGARVHQRLGDDPPQTRRLDRIGGRSRRERHRHERVARRGVVGEGRAAERHAEIDALRTARLERGSVRGGFEIAGDRVRSMLAGQRTYGEPTGAAAQVRGERSVEVAGPAAGEPHHDAGRAESRTASRRSPRTRSRRSPGPTRRALRWSSRRPIERCGRHARDARLTVDEHGAATALALRSAPVLGRGDPEALSQHVQQRFAAFEIGIDDNWGGRSGRT